MSKFVVPLLVAVIVLAALLFVALRYQSAAIFPGVSADELHHASLPYEAVRIERDGVVLRGWRRLAQDDSRRVSLIYFGGNAEDVSHYLDEYASLEVGNVYAFNYRGYSNSEGSPSQKGFERDALAIYDLVASFHGDSRNQNSKVIVIGRSIGSAVAGYVSAHRPVSGTVLLTPLKSVLAIAQQQLPWLPHHLLLQHPFRLDRYAQNIATPSLVVVATEDWVIPNTHSLATYEALAGEKSLLSLEGAGHADIYSHPEMFSAIKEFIVGL